MKKPICMVLNGFRGNVLKVHVIVSPSIVLYKIKIDNITKVVICLCKLILIGKTLLYGFKVQSVQGFLLQHTL